MPPSLYALIALVIIALLAFVTTKDSISRIYTFLVFSIFFALAWVLVSTLESRSDEKMFTSAGVLVCAMFILHKRIN